MKLKIKIPDFFTSVFIPNLNSVELLEYFLISAVSSLLLIRLYLTLTGFPQIGGGGFHIAHMLWGGLFMLIAIFLLIIFLDYKSKTIASILGGIGFGTFIDELGKFITSDNNYFFRPTIAIIYLCFVLIYLVIKFLSSYTKYSEKTYLINSLEILKEVVILDLNENEKTRALNYLKNVTKEGLIVAESILQIIKNATQKENAISYYSKIKDKFLKLYFGVIYLNWFSHIMLSIFIISTLFSSFLMLYALFFNRSSITFSVFEYVNIFTIFIISFLILIGIYFYIKKDKTRYYIFLQHASITCIFLFQFFQFITDEFYALINLVFYLSIYLNLKFLLSKPRN